MLRWLLQRRPRYELWDAGLRQLHSRDGRWILVAMQSTSQVAVVNLQTLQVVRTIAVPPAPHEIFISPENNLAYVSCTKSGKIAAISLYDWSIKKVIDAGNRVDGLGWTSSGGAH